MPIGGDDRDDRRGDYRRARVGAAAALTLVFVVLLIYDALSAEYEVAPLTLTVLAGTILTLLGIEAGTWLRGGK